MKKSSVFLFLAILLLSCASSSKKVAVDLSKYNVNNTLSELEHNAATATIYITTDPPSAHVFMDGKYVGMANKDIVYVIPGNREITLIKGELYFQKTIYFQEGSNRPLDVKLMPAQ